MKTLRFGKPADKSLQAYKDWIMSITKAFSPTNDNQELTPDEWEKGWREYWNNPKEQSSQMS